jgi:hypothetical protein
MNTSQSISVRAPQTFSARRSIGSFVLAGGAICALAFVDGCGSSQASPDGGAANPSDGVSVSDRRVRDGSSHNDATSQPATDVTTPPPADAGSTPPPVDAGSTPPPMDSGSTSPPHTDSGTTPMDAGSTPPPMDSGTSPPPPIDSGTPPPVDSGTPPPVDSGTTASSLPQIGGCTIFPADNPWNRDISADPVDPHSADYIANIQSHAYSTAEHFLHPDFGHDPSYGIPYVVVPATQTPVPITFNEYPSESDPGPYPVPSGATVEGGSDHHVLVVQQGTCHLYEMYHATYVGPGWTAGSGATWDLGSNALRTDGWTSCDQAGLPILPGLTRYDEAVTAGAIHHALRFTINNPGATWVSPARHPGTSTETYSPPMGARLRLRASFDLTPYHGAALVILQALKRYGMYVADTGTNWFISGTTDTRWNDADVTQLFNVPGEAFEVMQLGTLEHW